MTDPAPLSRNGLPRWDHSLPRSILSRYDLESLVHRISGPLHHCTGTTQCKSHDLCAMCGDAVRLVVQAAEPKILDAAFTTMATAVGYGLIDLHPTFHGEG